MRKSRSCRGRNKVLLKNIKLQQDTMNKLYDDPEFREKVAKTKEDIQRHKDQVAKLEEQRKKIKADQDKVLGEMAKLNGHKKKLREKKINVENGVRNAITVGKTLELQEEAEVIRNRNKNFENIGDKNLNLIKGKIEDKEKRIKQVEDEIKKMSMELKK